MDNHLASVKPAEGHLLLDPAALLLQDTKKATTRRAYAAGLRHFFESAGYGQSPTPGEVQAFLRQEPHALAYQLAVYRTGMRTAGLSPATINLRLTAVRSLITLSYKLGFCAVKARGLVDSEKAENYRDTRGTDLKNIKRLLALPDAKTLRGKRDSAILRLLCVKALRRSELCSLDVSDFDGADGQLRILGKGQVQRKEVSLPPGCVGAIKTYLAAAGHSAGPLFQSLDRRPEMHGQGLTVDGLYKLVGGYGKQIGLKLTPHKLRHSAITIFLDNSGGNVLEAQGLSRHADIRTLAKYDDNRKDWGGQASTTLEELMDG